MRISDAYDIGAPGSWLGGRSIDCWFQRPLYEYDVYVYKSSIDPKSIPSRSSLTNFALRDTASPLLSFDQPPFVRIAFLGEKSPTHLAAAGIPFYSLAPAHSGLSDLILPEIRDPFTLNFVSRVVDDLRREISIPIHQFLRPVKGIPDHPFNHFPLLVNRSRDIVGAYGSLYNSNSEVTLELAYLALPSFAKPARALTQILIALADAQPELFPDRPGKRTWLATEEFAFAEELAIDEEISAKTTELTVFIEAKQRERTEIGGRYEFMRRILVATEDSHLDKTDRLSTAVQHALEYLGFVVEDIDEQTRGAIRKEDFWARDGDFIAIVEVTGTRSKNPKTKEYNDILGRMTTIFKRRDLVPDASSVSGLLILNHDLETHPTRRPRIYTGDQEEISEAAAENEIGLISSVDLYRILVAVKDGLLERGAARDLLKQAGRIEFPTPAVRAK